jgi:xylan 1,4-beta-xylosidase
VERIATPMQTWSNLGKLRNLNKEQLRILQASAELCQTDFKLIGQYGRYDVELTIPCKHRRILEITPVDDKTDTYLGYDPDEFYGMV